MSGHDAPQEARDAATILVDALLTDGVDPSCLRDALRTQLAYNLMGSLAAPDAWAPSRAMLQARRPDSSAMAAAAAAAAAAPAPRACENPACNREADREHRHCCKACRDHHWNHEPPELLTHEHRCGRYRSTPRLR